MIAKFAGKCRKCGAEYAAGTSVRYSNLTKQVFCTGCWGNKSEQTERNQNAMAGIMARATEAHLAERVAEIQESRVVENPRPADLAAAQREAAPATSLAAIIAAAVQSTYPSARHRWIRTPSGR